VQVLMMGFWVMLGEIVSFVGGARSPEDVILALANMIANPIKLNANGFGPFLFDVIVGNSSGCGIVGLNRSGRLWMSKFLKGNAQWASMFGIEEQHPKFSPSSTGQDQSHDLTEDVNGSIVWWQVVSCGWQSCGLGAKEMVISSAGATFGGSEV